jgi:hypothetical protein
MKKIKRNDRILIVLIVSIVFFSWIFLRESQVPTAESGLAVVTVDGKIYGRYPLKSDIKETIHVGDNYNVMEIQNGVINIKKATCPDQVCVKHRSISRNNESVVCLPNRFMITIQQGTDEEIDSTTY